MATAMGKRVSGAASLSANSSHHDYAKSQSLRLSNRRMLKLTNKCDMLEKFGCFLGSGKPNESYA